MNEYFFQPMFKSHPFKIELEYSLIPSGTILKPKIFYHTLNKYYKIIYERGSWQRCFA